jgi:hypothetical protein
MGGHNTTRTGDTMKNEILNALRTIGSQPTSVLSYAFGSGFAKAIKALHNEGKVEKTKNGWKATQVTA